MYSGKIALSSTIAAVMAVALLVVGVVGGYFVGISSSAQNVVTRTEYVTVGGTVTERITITITSTASPSPASAPPLKIGMTISKDGLFAPLTSGYEAFNREWLNWVNNVRKGVYLRELGVRVPVEIIMYDDRSQPDLAIQLYTKLATEDNVHILVSPYSADIGIQLIPTVAERYRVPMIMAEASTKDMWNKGYRYVVTSMVPYWEPNQNGWSASYFELIKQTGWARTIAFVGWDITWAIDTYNSGKELARQAGLEIVYDQLLTPGTTDFSGVIRELKSIQPDIVYLAMFGPVNALFIRQANEAGFKPKEFHVIEYGAGFVNSLGPLAEGVTSEIFWTPSFKFYQSDLLNELMTKAGLNWVDWQWTELRMIIFQMIVAAVEEAGKLDREAINNALHRLQIMTVSGPLIIGPQGYGNIGLVAIQIQNGRIQTVWPSELANATYVYPRS
ncbi:MAG: ABC transporter substrate-binding protein [Candidatus Caldarchaeum sp.]